MAPFLMDLSLGMFMLGISLMLSRRFNATQVQISVVNALGLAAYMVNTRLAGRLVDRGWRSKMLILAPVVGLVALNGMLFSTSWWHAFPWVMVYHTCAAMFWPSLITTISRSASPARVLRGITVFSIAWVSGICVGVLLSGILHDLSWIWPFVGCAVMMLVLIPVSVYTDRHHSAPEKVLEEPSIDLRTPGDLRQHYFLRMAWISVLVTMGCSTVAWTLFPQTADKVFHMTGSETSVLAFFIGFTQMIGFLFFGLFPTLWFYRVAALMIVQCCSVLGCLMLGYCSSYGFLVVAMMSIGLGYSLPYLTSITYSVIGTDNPGAKSGIHESMIGAGGLLIPLIASQASRWHKPAVYYAAAGLVFIAIVAEMVVLYRMCMAERQINRYATEG